MSKFFEQSIKSSFFMRGLNIKNWSVVALLGFLSITSIHGAPKSNPDLISQLTPQLNSDRITTIFGSYGIDPIQIEASPFAEGRVSNLYSIEQGQKVMRTLAVTNFAHPVDPSLQQVHAKVCEGASIGIALRNAGWNIEKTPLYFGTINLSPQVQAWMDEAQERSAAVHIYQLNVFEENKDQRIHYCSIIEIHSPQYLDKHWLQLLYPAQYPDFLGKTEQVDQLLQSVEKLIQEFPSPEKSL